MFLPNAHLGSASLESGDTALPGQLWSPGNPQSPLRLLARFPSGLPGGTSNKAGPGLFVALTMEPALPESIST